MLGYRIAELLDILPQNLSVAGEKAPSDWNNEICTSGTGLITARMDEIERVVTAYKSVNWAWSVAIQLLKKNMDLPEGFCAVEDQAIIRAYKWAKRTSFDTAMIFAVSLGTDKRMECERNTINALTMCRDYDREWVAKHFDISPDALWVYEQLFFNVPDRRAEGLWLTSQAYPNGIIEEHLDDYISSERVPQLLKRAGLKNGMSDVLNLAGVPAGREMLRAMSLHEMREALENEFMRIGLLLAKNGWAGQRKNAHGLQRAQALISAGKIGGAQGGDDNRMLEESVSSQLYRNLKVTKRAEAVEQHRILVGATGRN